MALLVICGPTAVGKTAAAIAVAGRLGGEIVCADSRTIYRGMDIGTAKPTSAVRARVAHHLLDIANPDQVVTLATYGELAMAAIARVRANGRVPILTGGTGLYIRAVVDGFAIPQVPPDPQLRTDRKSTRLNSSHQIISYAVFCLKKKKKNNRNTHITRNQTPKHT